MSRLLAALLGLVLAASVSAGPAAAPAAAAPVCDTYGLGAKAPVLLVHGFQSSGDTWNTQAYPRGGELPGARGTFIAKPFDYAAEATEWIQGNPKSTAARRLAERIQCLAQASSTNGGPGKVALVGHSMGGLLIRCALSTECSRGPDVVALAGQVVTIGTPSLGSFLRSNAAVSAAFSAYGRVVQAQCAAERALSRLPAPAGGVLKAKVWATRGFCDLIDEFTNSSAARAFTMGSPELANLPRWPAGVPVRTIAASIDFTYQLLAWAAASINVGDAVVGVDSASSGAGAGSLGGTRTLDCGDLRLTTIPLPGVTTLITAVPNCNHVTETGDKAIAGMVGQAVDAWTTSMNRPLSAADLRSAPVPALCDFPAGRLVNGRLPGQLASAGQPPTLVTSSQGSDATDLVTLGELDRAAGGDAAAVVNCNAGGVGWPDNIVFWSGGPTGPTVLGAYQMGDAVGDARDGTIKLTYQPGGRVVVDSLDAREFDLACCPTGRARVTLTWNGRQVVATDVQRLLGSGDVTFAGIGQVQLGMTAQELVTLGYSAGDGNYYGCVFYTAGDDAPSVMYDPTQDAVVKITPRGGGVQTTNGLTVGSSLTDVRSSYADKTIEEYLDGSFGQGASGLLVGDGSGGWISFGTVDGYVVSDIGVSDRDHYGALEAGCE